MSSPQNASADVATKTEHTKPRRFAPEPIETSTKSSKSRKTEAETEDTPKVRRFAPQPIETTTKSSRTKDVDSTEEKKPAPRRFAPQPIETTTKSSKDRSGSSHIKFKPQLVETSYGGNRSSSSRRTSMSSDGASTVASEDATPRKFTPVVISTAKRSRRKGDSNAANYQNYKTEEGFNIHAREHQKHAGWKTPAKQGSLIGEDLDRPMSPRSHEVPPELRRPISPLDGSAPERPKILQTQSTERSHSFRCPDLDTIESSESERESGPSSMSCSPGQGSPITASDSSYNDFYKHATRMRESVDENFSHYLLSLEAKRARQRLQEQALAAFPNSDFHEPVAHYVNSEQDSEEMEIEDRPVTWEGFDEEEFISRAKLRRDSTNVPWEQLEMQRHAEQREQERRANGATEKKQESRSPWWNPAAALSVHQQDNSEMRSMRDRARPPMLGRDLVFPRCPSPEPARFDVTQGSATLRKQMCYLSEQSDVEVQRTAGGLWAAPAPKATPSASPSKSAAKKSTAGKGLWGGFCSKPEEEDAGLSPPPTAPTGLMTPAPRGDNFNPFEQSFATRSGAGGQASLAPPTPPESVDLNRLDAVLNAEKTMQAEIEREFPDEFITQVYNYLSLGYPSLAKPFDEELSKISGIGIKELREDDVKAKQSPRGYIRLGQDFEGGGGITNATECKRWQALKLYVHEWAKQEKNMVQVDAPGGNWATTQRRGSWAI